MFQTRRIPYFQVRKYEGGEGEREKDYNVTKNSLVHLQKRRGKFMR
jgi:hypothetical protein